MKLSPTVITIREEFIAGEHPELDVANRIQFIRRDVGKILSYEVSEIVEDDLVVCRLDYTYEMKPPAEVVQVPDEAVEVLDPPKAKKRRKG